MLRLKTIVRRYSRPNCSAAWKDRQLRDPFVRQAASDNLRSRSAFKLLQVNERYNFMKAGDIVLDCGGAPGGWTQVAVKCVHADLEQAQRINLKLGLTTQADYYRSVRDADVMDGMGRRTYDSDSGNSDGIEVWSERKVLFGDLEKSGRVVAVDLLRFEDVPGASLIYPANFLSPATMYKVKQAFEHRPVNVILSDMLPNLSGQREADHENGMSLVRAVIKAAKELPLQRGGNMFFKIIQGGTEEELKADLSNMFKNVISVKPQASRKESRELYILCTGYKGNT